MNQVEELLRICDIESDKDEVGWRKRRKAILEWWATNTHTVCKEMSVLNPAVFTSDNMDIIKTELAKEIAEDLTTYTTYKISGRKIEATVVALKTPPKK